MNNTFDVLGLIAGIGFLISGAGYLFIWYRDRKNGDHKKLGYGFLVVGFVLVLRRVFGL